MDWKLIFQLSLFGLAMGIATVFLIPPNIEPACWLVIFLICAYIIAKRHTTGRFAHGLLLGLVNSVWITSAHILLFDRYIAGHAQEAAMMKSIAVPVSPTVIMAVTGMLAGLASGAVIGLLTLGVGKVIKSSQVSSYKTAA